MALNDKKLEQETIISLFHEMGRLAVEDERILEISVFGGSALALCFDWRESTRDIDYMPIRGAETDILEYANRAADWLGLPHGLLRPDVGIFASDEEALRVQGEYPPAQADGHGLRVFVAAPEYLLSMKILAMRSSLETQDVRDVWHLLDFCMISEASDALALVEGFYPGDKVPVRNQRILEDIIASRLAGEDFSEELGW